MSICIECGKEIDGEENNCPYCGCPIETEEMKETDTIYKSNSNSKMKSSLERLRSWLTFAVVCFAIASMVFFYKAYNVKNNYYNSEFSSINKNAYVGGDAYNYIINGNYFTGYSVLGASSVLSAVVLCSSLVLITIKIKECDGGV